MESWRRNLPLLVSGSAILGLVVLMRRRSLLKIAQVQNNKQLGTYSQVVARQATSCKTVHFVRHAQALHNEKFNKTKDRKAYQDPRFEDAELTALGKEQCATAKAEWASARGRHGYGPPELVVVSPLRRCLQTATLAFGQYAGQVPWVALEEVRERNGHHPCDRRRPLAHARKEFPHVDFSLVKDEEDVTWGDGRWRESDEEMAVRSAALLKFLAGRPERNIIVVTHSAFLLCTFNKVVVCEPELRRWFANCERRSVALDFGADPATRQLCQPEASTLTIATDEPAAPKS